jgi:hypothetical protein
MHVRRAYAVRAIAFLSTALSLCALDGTAQAAQDRAEPAALHRLSAHLAPAGYATFTGDFGLDNPSRSDTNYTDNAPVFAGAIRYGTRMVDGVELGAGLEFIRPYGEPDDNGSVKLRLNALNMAVFVRPYLLAAGGRLEFGISGRIGVATGFWGSSLMEPGWTLSGGADVRVPLNESWALGGEVTLTGFQIRHGGSEPENTSLKNVSAIGFALLPLFSVTRSF